MSRQALYRKYRPADLSDVIGQAHIVRSLESALVRDRIAHAYLLTGPRGTGKTSVARILARRVNQLPVEHDIAAELDILEIDAASNRGIDEIRALRDKIAVAPARLTYKVYIVDEVHMLTREAFNALLKTLEEPPPHAVFILATTEVHKLPDTVISRTQRFDFRPVRAEDMVAALRQVAQAESVAIDDDALSLVAQLSGGGFRDALGLLDQLSAHDSEITRAVVAELAGVGDDAVLRDVIQLAVEQKFNDALQKLSEVWARGGEPTLVLEHMLHLMRAAFLDIKSEFIPRQSQYWVLQALTTATRDMKLSPIPSLPIELALWRIAHGEASEVQRQAPIQQASTPAPASRVKRSTPPAKVAARPAQNSLPEGALSPQLISTKALSLIKTKNNSLYAVLRSGEPALEDDKFVVRCRFRFHKDRIEEHKNRQFIEAVLEKVAGRPIELVVVHTAAEKPQTQPAEEELVASALEILGGEMVED